MSRPPMPPKPVPKPGKVRVYRASFAYSAERADELSFEEGDLLYVSEAGTTSAGEGWLRATCAGRSGLIPANYVEESAESLPHPLHEAAKRGNLEQAEECLRNGVSANSLDASGSTPLYWAAHGGHLAVLRRLLEVPGLARDSANKLGDGPVHAAAWKGRDECLRALLDAGASHTTLNRQGLSPLQLASTPETKALLQLLASQPQPPPDDEQADDSQDSD